MWTAEHVPCHVASVFFGCHSGAMRGPPSLEGGHLQLQFRRSHYCHPRSLTAKHGEPQWCRLHACASLRMLRRPRQRQDGRSGAIPNNVATPTAPKCQKGARAQMRGGGGGGVLLPCLRGCRLPRKWGSAKPGWPHAGTARCWPGPRAAGAARTALSPPPPDMGMAEDRHTHITPGA